MKAKYQITNNKSQTNSNSNVNIISGELGESLDKFLVSKYPPSQPANSTNVGFQICVYLDGKIAIHKAYGLAKREPIDVNNGTKGIPMTTGHQMNIASNSKKFAGIMLLHYLKRYNWDIEDRIIDRINTEFPSIDTSHWWYNPNHYHSPTFSQLLSHSAGFEEGDDKEGKPVNKPNGYIAYLCYNPDLPDTASEGARLSYSNAGATLAGVIIMLLSGKSYAEAFEDVINPVAMEMHKLVPANSVSWNKPNISREYEYDIETQQYKEYYCPVFSGNMACSDIRSNAGDSAKFMQVLLDNGKYTNSQGKSLQIVDEDIVQVLIQPRSYRWGYLPTYYGCFMAFSLDIKNGVVLRHYYHTGSSHTKTMAGFFKHPIKVAYHWQHNTHHNEGANVFHTELVTIIENYITKGK